MAEQHTGEKRRACVILSEAKNLPAGIALVILSKAKNLPVDIALVILSKAKNLLSVFRLWKMLRLRLSMTRGYQALEEVSRPTPEARFSVRMVGYSA